MTKDKEYYWQKILLEKCEKHNLNPAPENIATTSKGWLNDIWAIEWLRKKDAVAFKIEQDKENPNYFYMGQLVIKMPEMKIILNNTLHYLYKQLNENF